MQPIKPGWQTSEAWITGGVLLAGLLVQIGFVNSADLSRITDGWSQAVTAIFTLLFQASAAVHYLHGRNALKGAHVDSSIVSVNTPGSDSPTSMNAGWLIALAMCLLGGSAFAQAPRPPIITAASTPSYILPWRAWMHGQLGNQQQASPQPIIINQPAPVAPAAPPATDPAVVSLLQQQVQLHQQQVFLQQQIASLLQAGVAHQAAPLAPVAPSTPVPPPLYYPAPQGVQPLPAVPQYPVQPLPIAPQYPVQPLPVAPLYPVQPLPQVAPAPVQPLPVAPPGPVQPLPIGPAPAPKLVPAPSAPQALPVMPPASAYQRFTHALASPAR